MNQLPAQTLRCFGWFVLYVLPCLVILVPIRFLTRVSSFVFRKLLHFVAFTCITMMILTAGTWQAAALTALLIAVIVYPVLAALENKPWFGKLFVQKSPGEIKRSMLLLFSMFAALIFVSWDILGQPHLAAAAILMWGTGDAAAALIGVPFGRHKVHLPFTDGKKSWEGSLAMLLVSFLSGMIILCLIRKMEIPRAVLSAGIGALLGAATELFSPSEYDTVTVPVVIITVLFLLNL